MSLVLDLAAMIVLVYWAAQHPGNAWILLLGGLFLLPAIVGWAGCAAEGLGGGATVWCSAVFLGVLTSGTILSFGIFYVPAALALIVAALVYTAESVVIRFRA